MSEELFSYRLRRFREERGLLQDELAEALGVTGRYIGTIERGQKDVDPNSALYKLFLLMEQNKVPVKGDRNNRDGHSNGNSARSTEESPPYKTSGGSLGLRDALDQVRADLTVLETGTISEKRRAMTFLREVHLPILARALKLE